MDKDRVRVVLGGARSIITSCPREKGHILTEMSETKVWCHQCQTEYTTNPGEVTNES